MADTDIKSIILRFTAEGDDAKDEMATLLAIAAEMDHTDVDMDVNVATAGAEADFTKILALAKLVDDTDVEVDVDIKNFNFVERILRDLSSSMHGAGEETSQFGEFISKLNVNLPGFLGRLNKVSGAAFAAALAIGVTLVGALSALVASLAAAVAGLAALAAAFAAALGPAVLIVVGVVQRLAAVWKVLKQEDEAQLQAQQKRIEGNRAVASALEQQRQAVLQLKRAQADLGAASAEAYREMEDAAERATDAVLGLARAQLDSKDAALGLKEARFELKKFLHDMKIGQEEASALFDKFTDVAFDPSKLNKQLAKVKVPGVTGLDREEQELKLERLILNVQEARQGEKEATDGVSDAIREKTRAEQDNQQFVEKGIKASARYVSALRAVKDAHHAVAQAQKAVVDAKTISAQAKVQAMTEQLSTNEKILLGVLRQVRDAFKETFGPGIQSVIKGIALSLLLIAKRIKPLRKAFTTLGDAMAGGLVFLTDQLTSPKIIGQIAKFAQAATLLILPLSHIFLSLAQIFLNIAQAALPLLLPLVERLAGALDGVATASANMGAVRGVIIDIVAQFVTWINLLFQIGRVFFNFIKIAAPFGQQFANDLARAAKAMADWLGSEEGRKQVQEFLQVAIPLAEKLGGIFVQLVVTLIRLGEILGPILSPFVDIFTQTIKLGNSILRLVARLSKALGDLLTLVVDNVTKPILAALQSLVDKAVSFGMAIIDGIIEGMKKGAKKLGDFAKKLADKIAGPFKKALSIFSPSKVFAGYGENIVDGLVGGLKKGSKNLSTAVEMHLVAPTLDPMQTAVAGASGATRGLAAVGGGRGGDTILQIGDLVLPEPASGGLADPRAQAVQLFSELQRSGRKGRR